MLTGRACLQGEAVFVWRPGHDLVRKQNMPMNQLLSIYSYDRHRDHKARCVVDWYHSEWHNLGLNVAKSPCLGQGSTMGQLYGQLSSPKLVRGQRKGGNAKNVDAWQSVGTEELWAIYSGSKSIVVGLPHTCLYRGHLYLDSARVFENLDWARCE